MLQFLESLYLSALLLPPFVAAFFFFYSLFRSGRRQSLIWGICGLCIGFSIGAAAGGGFDQTGGWGFGNFGALVLGISGASTGFLCGLGFGFLIGKKGYDTYIVVSAAVLPIVIIALHRAIVPGAREAEYQKWEKMIVEGQRPDTAEIAKLKANGKYHWGLKNFALQYPLKDLPPQSIQTLYQAGVIDGSVRPMSPAVAWAIFEINEWDHGLARNPEAPPVLIRQMAEAVDFSVRPDLSMVVSLSRNPLTPESEISRLLLSVEEQLAATSPADFYATSEAVGTLTEIMRNHELEFSDATWRILLERNRIGDNLRKLSLPEWVIREIYNPEKRDRALAANPSVPSDLLSASLRSVDFQDPKEYLFLQALVENPNLSEDDLRLLKEQGEANKESSNHQLARKAQGLINDLLVRDRKLKESGATEAGNP